MKDVVFSHEEFSALLRQATEHLVRRSQEHYCHPPPPSKVRFYASSGVTPQYSGSAVVLVSSPILNDEAILPLLLRPDGAFRDWINLSPFGVRDGATVLSVEFSERWTTRLLEPPLAHRFEPFHLLGPSLPPTVDPEGPTPRVRLPLVVESGDPARATAGARGRRFQDESFLVEDVVGCTVADLFAIHPPGEPNRILMVFLVLQGRWWQRFFLDACLGFWEEFAAVDALIDFQDLAAWDCASEFGLHGEIIRAARCLTDGDTGTHIEIDFDRGTLGLYPLEPRSIESDSTVRWNSKPTTTREAQRV